MKCKDIIQLIADRRLKKQAAIELDIEEGDIVLGGRYKNQREVVKEVGTDELGQPTINGKKLLSFRIEKALPDSKKSRQTLAELQKAATLRTAYREGFEKGAEESNNTTGRAVAGIAQGLLHGLTKSRQTPKPLLARIGAQLGAQLGARVPEAKAHVPEVKARVPAVKARQTSTNQPSTLFRIR